jgi:uncharacterized protein (UPF0276 family)
VVHDLERRPGIGLRAAHADAIEATRPALGFLEVHAENYLAADPQIRQLLRLRETYALSLHGVGLSLGSADGIDAAHLQRFRDLVRSTQPAFVSEHLSWSVVDGAYLNDLLPLPYTEEALRIVARNIDIVQEALGRAILIENPSRYLRLTHSTIAEPEFIAQLVRRTGCHLLCDVNNIYVSSINCDEDPHAYLRALPRDAVREYHLAGHARVRRDNAELLIDDHGAPVSAEVWALYRRALDILGPAPVLIEWDRNLPALPTLLAEAHRAENETDNARPALAG